MSKNDKVQEHDKKILHNMGYAQQLARRMSGFSNFAISFSIICILAGGITTFPTGFSSTGGAGIGIGWLVGGAVAIIVALSMGQIASAYPTAGGLYHWASILGGRAWGWVTAWFNVLGLVFVVSSVDVGVWLLFRDLVLVGIFKMDPASFTVMHQLLGVAVILISHALFNHYGIELTTKLTDFSGYLIFVVAILLTISLLVFSPVALDFSRLFTFSNFTGDPGGGVFPRTENLGFAFLFGLILVCYTITGYDASAHTSEETHDAQVNVPKGMWQSVFYSVLFGYFMVASFVLAMPSVEEGASKGWGAFFYVMESSLMPQWLLYVLFVGIVAANYLCGLAGLTSASRMTFAFARDGGLPASGFLSHVDRKYRTPTYSIWVVAFFAWLSTVYANAFVVLATACAVFLYFSYISPVVAGFFAEGKTWTQKGPFDLKGLSKPLAVVSVIGGFVLAITGFQPPNEKVFYLTVAMVIVMGILWVAVENKRFEGPPTGDRIKERQAKIAEIEAQYND
ncbi:MAG: amino acid permease [Chloroflexi bacterium]|nr:amino acid permease [Chloroflexota bacterium]